MPSRRPPKFVKQLGLDFIITPENKIYLIELQAGFGRLGPQFLFPRMWRKYRSLFRQQAFASKPNERFLFQIKRICRDKVKTYRHFKDLQPRSFFFRRWDSPKLKRWLSACTSDYVLAKPPLGTCGTGIKLLAVKDLLKKPEGIDLGTALLLQEYVFSRDFRLQGDAKSQRVGCIRHILLMRCDGEKVHILHLPSYWRVAPESFTNRLTKNSLTANMSRGAIAIGANAQDTELIRELSNRIACRLVALSLKMEHVQLGAQTAMDFQGVITAIDENEAVVGY